MILIVRDFLDGSLGTNGGLIFPGWDAHCAGLDTARKREADWKETEQKWESAPISADADDWGPIEEGSRWVGSDVQSFLALYDMYRGVWLNPVMRIEVIDVPVDFHSVLEGSLDKERSACRSLYLFDYLSVSNLLSFL
jgi:hypothetical protein